VYETLRKHGNISFAIYIFFNFILLCYNSLRTCMRGLCGVTLFPRIVAERLLGIDRAYFSVETSWKNKTSNLRHAQVLPRDDHLYQNLHVFIKRKITPPPPCAVYSVLRPCQNTRRRNTSTFSTLFSLLPIEPIILEALG
jgi:hypothetical protein